jgi:outer membrane scaffolding protein for murein synthesis (MipA/OmpV family)
MKCTTILPAILLTAPVFVSAQTATAVPAPTKNWSSSVGIATVAMPGYAGSNRYRVRTVPILQLDFKDRVYLGSSTSGVGGGVGVYMMKKSTMTLSAELNSAGKRRESYGDGLAGMGTRDGGTFVGTNASYRVQSVTFGGGFAVGTGKGEGATGSLNIDTKKRLGERWIGGLATGATFSNRQNMAFDFGISPVQAGRREALIESGDSRLSVDDGGTYAPKGGLKQAQASASLGYLLTSNVTALAFVNGTRLGRQAADSPLTRQRNGVIAGIGMAFGL